MSFSISLDNKKNQSNQCPFRFLSTTKKIKATNVFYDNNKNQKSSKFPPKSSQRSKRRG